MQIQAGLDTRAYCLVSEHLYAGGRTRRSFNQVSSRLVSGGDRSCQHLENSTHGGGLLSFSVV
jgi:hypothetical protein